MGKFPRRVRSSTTAYSRATYNMYMYVCTGEESHASRRPRIPHPVSADRTNPRVYWKPVPTSTVISRCDLPIVGGRGERRGLEKLEGTSSLPLSPPLETSLIAGTRDFDNESLFFSLLHARYRKSIDEKRARKSSLIIPGSLNHLSKHPRKSAISKGKSSHGIYRRKKIKKRVNQFLQLAMKI